jgi:hypothetical protein
MIAADIERMHHRADLYPEPELILRHVTFAREHSAGEPSRRRALITMPRRSATVTLVSAQP